MSSHNRVEIAFVDTTLDDYQTLVDGLASNVEVILIDGNSGGFDQITDALSGREDIDAIHLLSHGDTGAVHLAGDVLSEDTLGTYDQTLAAIRSSLSEEGDLLLYGCNVGEGGEGQAFVESLSSITGADVAASDDLTGDDGLGGDWDLEVQTGAIENQFAVLNYGGVLAPDQVVTRYLYVRPNETTYNFTWGEDIGYNGSDWVPSQINRVSFWNTTISNGYFQYSSNGGSSWTDIYVSTAFPGFTSVSGTIWRYVSTSTGDPAHTVGFSYHVDGITNSVGTSFFIKEDTAPTDITATNATSTVVVDTPDGGTVDTFDPTDVGLTTGGVWELESQSHSGLFTLSSDTSSKNEADLILNASALPAEGTQVTVTVRYYDLYQTDSDGNALANDGISKTFTYTVKGLSDDLGFTDDAVVNSLTGDTANQDNPAIAELSTGDFVVAWDDQTNGGIYAQKFNSAGVAQGSNITIDSGSNMIEPEVTALSGGKYAVVYRDASTKDIVFSIVEANGTVGSAVTVASGEYDDWSNLDIMASSDGTSFTVRWNLDDYSTLKKATYTDSGTIVGSVETLTPVGYSPESAVLSNGDIVTAVGSTPSYVGLSLMINDTAIQSTFDTPIGDTSVLHSLAALSGGGFVLVWIDATGLHVNAQVFDNAGAALAPATIIQVETTVPPGSGYIQAPTVSAMSDGGFVVTWGQYDIDGNGSSIQGRRFEADGTAVDTNQFQVNQYPYGDQKNAAVEALSTGAFVTTWTDTSDTATGSNIELRVAPSAGGPEIAIGDTSLTYTEGDAATQIDATATLTAENGDADWNGGTLVAQITSNAEAGDQISISDTDGDGVAITVSGTDILAGGTDIGDLSVSGGTVTNGTALTITFDSDATEANVQEVLQSLRYSSTADDPGASDRTITVTATDTNSKSTSDTRTVSITTVNDEPTLTATGSNPSFAEGGSAASLFSSTSVSTVESGQTISGLTLTVTNVNDGGDELLNVDGTAVALTHGTSGTTATNSLSYSVSVSGTTATVTLSGGTMSAAATQTMIDAISYQNDSDDPNTSNRVVTLTSIQDSGGTANSGDDTASLSVASTVSMTAVNDEPTLTATGSDPTFTEGGSATSLFSSTSVSTVEAGQTVSGLTVTVTNVSDASERLNIDGTAIDLTNGNSGTTATNSLGYSVSMSGTTATVTLSGGTMSAAATQTLVDGMSYQNNSDDPSTSNRVVTVTSVQDSGGTANSGDDTASLSVASTVTLAAVNDEPTLTATGSNPTFTEGGAAASLFGSASVSTVETGQTVSGLVLTVTNVSDASERLNIDGTAIDLTNGNSGTTATNSLGYSVSMSGTTATVTLSGGTMSAAATQTLVDGMSYQNNSDDPSTSNRVVTLTSLQDSGGTANSGDDTASLSVASTVTMTAVNDEPTLTATGSNPTFSEGGSAVSLFTSSAISTVESGQNITSLVLTLTNVANDGSNERLVVDGSNVALSDSNSGTTASNSFGYSVSLSAGTATVTLTNTTTASAWQTLVDGITYENTGTAIDTNNRVVTITTLNDDGGTANSGDDSNAALSVVSTVASVPKPTITSVTYDSSTNQVTVTGTNFVANSGATNDVDLSKLTFTGESGNTYTLTTATDVEITSATEFSFTLSGADLYNVEALLNQDGTSASSGTVYNLAAADDFIAALTDADTSDTTANGITVSNYAVPSITSATYDASNGQLVITGANFVNTSGASNDIDASLLTITGEGSGTYTLTDTVDVEISSDTTATITLSSTDQLNVHGLLNKDGTSADDATTYNLAAAEDWMPGAPAVNDIVDATGNGITVSNIATPTVTSATYDYDTGVLIVTGTNFVKALGADNDVDLSALTLTGGVGDQTYTLTTATDVEITSATEFSLTLSGSDKTGVDALLDQLGTSSSGGSTYNLGVADNWMTGAAPTTDITDAIGNSVTVTISPKVSSATYDAATGTLVVTGTDIQENAGGSDIDASLLTLTGEGGATYTLTDTSDVNRDSATQFTLTLSATDKAAVNQILNQDGTSSTDSTAFNLAVADDWNTNVTTGDTSDTTGNSVTVSNVAAPTITSSTYDASTGTLVVTGADLLSASGASNDIDVSLLTFTGEGGETYTLTDSSDVDITSGTSFTVSLSATDKTAVNLIVNKDGTSSTSGTTYNLAAAEDWASGAATSVAVVDATGNGITVSNVPVPTVTSATYSAKTGELVVTGTNLLSASGANNDIDVSKLFIVGAIAGGYIYQLTSDSVEITSATEFTVTLNSTDQTAVLGLFDQSGTQATDTTVYNLTADDNWAAGADAAVDTEDALNNAITVTLNTAPTASDGTQTVSYNGIYTFQASDFGFTDTDVGDTLDHITIATLPVDGDLVLNGTDVTSTGTTVTLADLNSGLLVFRPDNGGTGVAYASFTFTVNDGTDDSTPANTITLDVSAPPPPEPDPENLVDGVEVKTETVTENGKEVERVTVEPVTDTRNDTDSTSNEADIPLHYDDDGEPVTTVSLPEGVGFASYSNDTARENNGIGDLITMINNTASVAEVQAMTTGGQSFLSVFAADPNDIWANEITLTTDSDTPPDAPITIQGNSSGSGVEALVIDASNLPSGTVLNLADVEFAVVVGPATLTGGGGSNVVYAGAGSQTIILGEDDDELYGGAGDDIIGSKGGDDLLHGDEGDDLVVGGMGNDTLEGGTGNDVLQGGQSESGSWSFAINTDGSLQSQFTAENGDLSGEGSLTVYGDWYSKLAGVVEGGELAYIADDPTAIAATTQLLQADDRLSFMAQDSAQLITLSVLYHAVKKVLPDVATLNALATQTRTQEAWSQLAYDAYLVQSANSTEVSVEEQVTSLVSWIWGSDLDSSETIALGTQYIENGGSWAQVTLYLAQHASHRDTLLDGDGNLTLTQDYQADENGWAADVGADTLRGGEGDDTLIGGRGDDMLDGGDGTDIARQAYNHDDYQLQVNAAGDVELVYRDQSYVETDTLKDIESLVFADQTLDVSFSNLDASTLKNVSALYSLLNGAGPTLEELNSFEAQQVDLNQLATNLMTSESYLETWGAMSNSDFVSQVTATTLGTALTGDALAYWTNQLDNGYSREEALVTLIANQTYQDTLFAEGVVIG